MGIFSKLKKLFKKEEKTYTPRYEPVKKKSEVKYSITKDGKLQIAYIDREAKYWNTYDTTRLIINNSAEKLNNKYVPECLVSWYGQQDAVMLNDSGEFGRRVDYKEVLADIDVSLIQTDPQYCEVVMKSLLSERRVNDYLTNGLKDTTERPCGQYIGGVRRTENGYGKFFDMKAGREAHFTPKMNWIRDRDKQMKINAMRSEIETKRSEIKTKRSEINKIQADMREI